MEIRRVYINGVFVFMLVPVAAHEIGSVVHQHEREKPNCVVMVYGCNNEHAGEPHAPRVPSLRQEIVMTTSSSTLGR
jgi:hypothetical protein